LTSIASSENTDHVDTLLEADILSHFLSLCDSPHPEVVEQVIWGIGNIAGDSPLIRDQVIDTGAL